MPIIRIKHLALLINEGLVVSHIRYVSAHYIEFFPSAGLNTLANHGYIPRK
jgi:hypothetical protein